MSRRLYSGVEEARQNLPSLLADANSGRPVVITKRGKPVAELRAVTAGAGRPTFGSDRGRITMRADFDAPLDDSNTERFCRMVRDMSEQTQFLYISHNKISMEMASQLIGITMPDPGISQVVAVDIADAVELAPAGSAVAAAA